MAVEIDCSYGEGGGQILRTSIALSSILGREVRLYNIRAKRPNPGLRRQHITAIQIASELCNAEAEGLEVGSSEVWYAPSKSKGKHVRFDIGTAGSITLALQVAIPIAIFADTETHIKLRGGTDVKWSPPFDYMYHVLLPILNLMGVRCTLNLIRRGYYPKGGGEVECSVHPSKLSPLLVEEKKGEPRVFGVVHTSGLPEHVGKRIKHAAIKVLIEHNPHIKEERGGFGTGAGITLWAEYDNTVLGADCLGEKGVPAERVGTDAANSLLKEMSAPVTVDVHCADQLLLYMALAQGSSKIRARALSSHAETNVWVIERFLGRRFKIEEVERGVVVSTL